MNSKILLMIVRVGGLVALIGGSIYWMNGGEAESLPVLHIILGGIVTVALFILTYQTQHAGVSKPLIILATIWTLGLPIWGLIQKNIFPVGYLWIAQILHVLCAIGSIGIAEILGAKTSKKGS